MHAGIWLAGLPNRTYRRLREVHPELPKYLAAVALMAVGGGIIDSVYNNYLNSQFHLTAQARGNLEFIREFPGLMIAVLMLGLAMLKETRIAFLSAITMAVGMIGFALVGTVWWPMLVCTLLWGIGSHLMMPVGSSLTMSLGSASTRGRRLGQVAAVSTIGTVVGGFIVWGVFGTLPTRTPAAGAHVNHQISNGQYNTTFYIAAAACMLAAIFYGLLRKVGSSKARQGFVVRKEYWLYYVLNVLYGARKQIFLTFGRWVLVTVYMQSPTTFAILTIVSNGMGIIFQPTLGHIIDWMGERKVLVLDSFMLMLVCLGYGSAKHLGLSDAGALILASVFCVLDQMFFAVSMARDTYVSKIARSDKDLTASLSMGVSINHIVAMTVPSLGGMLWDRCGYEWVFVAGGGVAILMTIFSNMVKVPPLTSDHQSPAPT